MQNVPQTSIAQAGKVEFSKVNSQSANDMSGDLFGAFMAYETRMDQESFAPAPNLEAFSDNDSSTLTRVDSASAAAATETGENVPVVPPVMARALANQNHSETRTAKSQKQHSGTTSSKNGSEAQASAQSTTRTAKSQAGTKSLKTTKTASETDTDPKAEVDMDDMRDLLVSLEDLEGMKAQLLQYGLSEQDVDQLLEQADSTQGLTWGKLVSFISKKMELLDRNLEFTPAQKQQLMTFFQKLGLSASDSEKLVAEMAEGNLDKVLATLDRHIKSMDKEQLLDLDLDEAKTFMEELRKLKAENQARELGMVRTVSQAMKKAVNRIRAQYAEAAQTQTNEAGTKESAQPVVNTKVADAARLNENKTVEQAAGTAAENAARIVKVLNPTEQTKVAVDQVMEKAAESLSLGGNDKPADHLLNQEPKGEKDAWSEFMGKMRQDPEFLGRSAKTASADALTAKESMADALTQARQNFNATLDKLDAPKVMRQVQDGIMRNLGQGRKQITLQLEPANLGKLSIVLSTNKGGEVQATIRPDNHESAKLIAENLDSIRQYMENQGVKVSKLEVQTQLSQYQGNEWYGEAGHNQAREQEAQSRMLNRWRTLKNSDAMDVQANAEAVRQAVSGNTGLHVIA